MPVSTHILRNIAIVGGFMSLGGAGYFTIKLKTFKEKEYFKQSVSILRNYTPIERTLGQPISARSIDLGSTENVVDGLNAKIAIPVWGPKNKGTLYCWASRVDVQDSWMIDKLDIEVIKPHQRWTFYKRPDLVEESTDS